MKALIIGGCGFIGSNVAERLYKEGYDIYIIDNLSEGKKSNVPIKHKLYQLDSKDHKCENVYKDNKFDVVVYLPDVTKEGVEGIKDALQYSSINGVKKFIYVSTTELYKKDVEIIDEDANIDPLDTKYIDILVAEEYCKIYDKKYVMDVVILRTSTVYGPKENKNNEYGVISRVLDSRRCISKELAIKNKFNELLTNKDCIYIDDLVDAIYKTVKKDTSFILNISSGHLYSNDKAKEELDWKLKYNTNEGIDKTYKWIRNNEKYYRDSKENHKTSSTLAAIDTIKPYVENIVLCVVMYYLTKFLSGHLIDINIDLNIIYIIIMATFYGIKQSVVSVVLASVTNILLTVGTGKSFVLVIYDRRTFLTVIMYLCVAVALGYVIDRKNDYIKEVKNKLEKSNEKFKFLDSMYQDMRVEKKELEEQVTMKEDSFAKLYTISEKINSLYVDEVYDEAVNVVSDVMKTDEVSIYIFPKDKQYLRLISKSKNLDEDIKKSIKITEYCSLEKALNNKELFINSDMYSNIPTMMMPIVVKEEVIGFVALSNVKFEELTLHNETLFKITTKLVTGALSRAYKYEKAIINEKYIKNTEVLTPEYFRKVIAEKNNIGNKEENVLIKVENNDYSKIKNCIRSIDYIGINDKEEVFIFVTNTKEKEATLIIDRLEKNNLEAKIIDLSELKIYGLEEQKKLEKVG